LAFPIITEGEADLPEIWAEPLPIIVNALQQGKIFQDVADNLPDIELANTLKNTDTFNSIHSPHQQANFCK
jgi:hypothetical protein